MAREPQRREQRRTHLDASVVPVERALLARAGALEEKSAQVRDSGLSDHARILMEIATEFSALAEELHFW